MALARLRAWIVLIATFAMATLRQGVLSSSQDASTYIIHMDTTAMPRAFDGPRGWYAATLSAATAASSPVGSATLSSAADSLLYVYDTAVHGFCARLSPSQLRKLQRATGFVAHHRDVLLRPDTTHTPEFLRLGPGSGLWPAAKYGEDVIVGVVDSGVWPESESYGDAGMAPVPTRWRGTCEEGTAFTAAMCNRKLVGARFFNRALFANRPNLTIRVNSPRDTDGHGTHTSSTAAGGFAGGASYFGYAGGTARGVAPRARVAVYKVLWGEGAFASDIVAGIDRAVADGVDVLSVSLGLDGAPLYADPVAIATFAAAERGIFVATSAGNQGPWRGLLHNGVPWQLTVGAGTVDREFSGIIDLGNGVSIVGISLYLTNDASPPLRGLPLVAMGTCGNRTALRMAGYKIVVCEPTGPLDSVIDKVTSAGVAAGLFISSSPFIEYNVYFAMPGAIVSPEKGKAVLDYIRGSPDPRASFRFQVTTLGTRPAPVVATYSSRGPSSACPAVLKPDLIAPGSLVLAAWPNDTSVSVVGSRPVYSPFNIISGSSMACPHAAGVAALLRGVHPGWSPAAVRSAMMTTADAVDNLLQPIKDMGEKYLPATPLAMGAGHVNPNKAMDPGLVYDAGAADYVKLLCAMNYTKVQIRTITREATDCSAASMDLNYPSFIAFFETTGAKNQAAARVFRRTLTNVAEGQWTYRAKVAAMEGFAVRVEPQVLVFREKGDKQGFVLTMESLRGWVMKQKEVVHGWLSWEDDQGKHRVRSPIVATTMGTSPGL
ncbi:hypothetical protein Taro_022407 [Colocasia esculenta]|uniref:Subtilisin-like protease n=1 Tax=Colocasia esculenta TaxID=4460 RepID=A0A843V8A0_COLES|nr:hypothetical protein [Colocasia esculenta]